MSKRRHGATGWQFSQCLLFTILLIAPLMYLSGCGSGQTDVGQSTSNSVPVSLSISMPQESAAASTSRSRFWATVQSWLPTPTNAWAVTYDLSELTVTVTDSDQQLLTTKTEPISSSHNSGDSIPINLEVPVGSGRIFAVSGVDRKSGRPILQGKSDPTTLTAGQAVTVPITLQAVSQLLLIITASSLPTGTVNQPYPTTTLTATGGAPPLTWDPVVTPPLPNGLTFNPNTATISGTPLNASKPTTHTFTVRDSTAPSNQTGTKGLLLTINSALTIDTTSLPSGTVGILYDVQLGASGGTPPYTWSIVGNDPTPAPGLTLSPAGHITGTPSTAQGNPLTRTYRVTDKGGVSRDTMLTITIGQQLAISTQASLPNGLVDTTYSATVTATGGTPPYTWSIVGGLMPAPGLFLSPSGTITGTPTTAGTFTGTYRVQDSNRAAVTKDLTLNVDTGTGTVTGIVLNEGACNNNNGKCDGFIGAIVAVNGTKISTSTGDNGNFILKNVPEGTQTLSISASGYASKTKTVTVPLGPPVDAGTITLNPAELANIQVTSYDAKLNLCFHPGFQKYPLNPLFNPEQSKYTVRLPSSTDVCIVMTRASLKQTVTLSEGDNTFEVLAPQGDPFPLNLYPIVFSNNLLFTIVVKSPDGFTQKTYTIEPLGFGF